MIIKILNLYNCLNMNKTSILVCLYLDNYTNKWLVTTLLFIKPFRFKKPNRLPSFLSSKKF